MTALELLSTQHSALSTTTLSTFNYEMYSEELAVRIRKRFAELTNVEEKKMMGGLVFMYNGKMCVGVMQDELMCRVDPALHNELVEKPGCRTMEFANRPAAKIMSGYILIDDSAMKTKKEFDQWIDLALDFNKTAKASKKKKAA